MLKGCTLLKGNIELTKVKFLMKKRNVAGVIVFIIILAIISMILINENNRNNREIRYELTAMGKGALIMAEMSREPNLVAYRASKDGFTTLDLALEYFFGDDLSLMGYEIKRFEEKQYVLIVLSGNIKGFMNRTPVIFLVMYEKRESGKYYFIDRWTQGINALAYDNSGVWHNEDRVARDIVLAYAREEDTSRVNGGAPLYYGVGVGKIPEHFLILGSEPDGVLQFEYREKQYFFWYFLNHQFGEILEQNLDVRLFTLGEVISLFEIEIKVNE